MTTPRTTEQRQGPRTVLSTAPSVPDDEPLARALHRAWLAGTLDGVRVGTPLRRVAGRRVTLAATVGPDPDPVPAILKVFGSPRARGNARRLRLLHAAGVGDLVPKSLRVDPHGHVGLLGFTPGRVLDTVDDVTLVGAASLVGRALARLHGCGAVLDRSWTWRDETAQLLRRMPESGAYLALRAAAAPVEPTDLVPSHRDFHPRQVVLDDLGVAHLIDLDDAAMAPAGLDVGNMVAHLRREAVIGRHSRSVVELAVREFLSGYGAPPPDLATWERLAMTRLVGLAEARHRDLAQRDGLLGLLDPARPPTPVPAPRLPRATAATGHADRPVRVSTATDGRSIVLKSYRAADGSVVHTAMEALWRSSRFGALRRPRPGLPRPLGFDRATRDLAMEHIDGPALAVRGQLGTAVDRAADVAALLADLHGSGVVVARRRSVGRLILSSARKVADRVGEPAYEDFRRTLDAITAYADAHEPDPTLVLSHGDFSPRNVLAAEDGLVLIDMDRLQLAAPARDVAYWTAWLWTTSTLADGPAPDRPGAGDPWELGESFVAAYRTCAPQHALGRRDLALHRALALLRIAHGWSGLRTDHDGLRRVLEEARSQLEANG